MTCKKRIGACDSRYNTLRLLKAKRPLVRERLLAQVMEYLGVIGLFYHQVLEEKWIVELHSQDTVYLGVIGFIPVKAYQRMLGLLLQVLEYLGVIGLIRVKAYQQMLGLLLQVMEYWG